MRAGILAIGSELLTPGRSETNAAHLTSQLLSIGVDVAVRLTVADDPAVLEAAFRYALSQADVVVATGGLGPTADDLTREAAAAALGTDLVPDPAWLEALRERFARFGRPMAAVNEKQADVIRGGELLPNPRGTAPGQWVERDGRVVVLLPGPPWEMEPLFASLVLPRLSERAGGALLRTRVLRIAGMGESDVEQLAAPIYTASANPRTTILSGPGQVELHLTAQATSEGEAHELLERLATRLRDALPGRVYSEDGRDLPEVVLELLSRRRLTLAVAESCTGGLLASRLTEVPGASAVFERGFVVYSNRAKTESLGVPDALIQAHGAVSEEVVRGLAAGARRAAGTDLGVGITGIAGPSGGTADKPVGLVFVALDGALGDPVRRLHLPGNRGRVRFQATQIALEMLRRRLLELPTA